MRRGKLLAAIAALVLVIAGTVVHGSPYAPVVQPVLEIEDVWALEDARRESDAPLIARLENHGMRLGYDATENTFYCPIGLKTGDEWPEIHLTAPGAKGVEIAFVDDYSYDWCSDALRDGYAYQIMAYTDEEFSYAQIVFTGLPVVTIDTRGEQIGFEDVAAEVTIASPEGGLNTRAIMHQRGAGSQYSAKRSYKVDFVHGAKDSAAIAQVPGIGAADDVLLVASVLENEMLRERLSWDVYGLIADKGEMYGPREMRFVEVFENDRYSGCYGLMEAVDNGEELSKRGANAPATDSVYRSAYIEFIGDRPYVHNDMREDSIYEAHHAPVAGREFDALEPYLALERLVGTDDEKLEEMALAHIDMASMLRYYLFIQGGGMSDNVFNNMYVIASMENGKPVYRFAPWDMDLVWGQFKDVNTGEAYHGLFSFDVCQRLIEIDAGGVTRRMLTDMWADMRASAFNEETITALMDGYIHELDASGAYARDALRWRGEEAYVDGYDIVTFAVEHFAILDEVFAQYAP